MQNEYKKLEKLEAAVQLLNSAINYVERHGLGSERARTVTSFYYSSYQILDRAMAQAADAVIAFKRLNIRGYSSRADVLFDIEKSGQ